MTAVALRQEVLPTLEELAATANDGHREVGRSLDAAVRSAITVGESLLAAHAQLGSDFKNWVSENLEFKDTTAYQYMRLARYQHLLPAEVFQPYIDRRGFTRERSSVKRAYSYLNGLPQMERLERGKSTPPSTRNEVKRLRAEGMPVTDVADLLGISRASVYRICDPQKAKEERRRADKRLSERRLALRLARKAELRTARDQAVKKAGGEIADAYSLIRRAEQRIDEAISRAEPECRPELEKSLASLYHAEDAIARALKIPYRWESHRNAVKMPSDA